MGVIRRQGIKSTIVSYSGIVLGALTALWLFPSFLSTEEIGLITLIISVSLIIAPLAQLGASGITIKFYPHVKGDKEKEGSLLFLTLLLPLIGFSLSMILLFLLKGFVVKSFAENSPLFIDYLFALVPFSFLFAFRGIFENISRTQLLVSMPSFFKEVVLRIMVIALVLVYYLADLPLSFFVYSYTVILAISLLLLVIYTYRLGVLNLKFSLAPLDKGMIRTMIFYGLFVIFSGFVNNIVMRIDGYMISSMIDLSNNGIYAIALYIGVAVSISKKSIILITLPIISKEFKDGNIQEVEKLYKKSSIIQLVIGSILLICIWVSIDDLFELIPNGEIFKEGKYVVLFIGIATLIDMATGVNNEIIYMSNFYRYFILIVSVLILVAILNNYLLIPIYGITGAAMATAISYFIFNFLKYLLLYIKLRIQPFTINTVKVLIVSTILFLVGISLPGTSNHLLNIGLKSIFLIAVYTFVIYRLKVSEDINNLYLMLVEKVKGFF